MYLLLLNVEYLRHLGGLYLSPLKKNEISDLIKMIKCSVTMDSSSVAVDSVKVNLKKKKKKKIKENKRRIQKKDVLF